MKDPCQQLYDSLDAEGLHSAREHTSPPRRFRASEANNCVRLIWHRLHGDRPAPRNGRSLMYGVCGDVDHDLTRQLYNAHGVPIGGVTFGDDNQGIEHMFYRKEIMIETPTGTVPVTITARADGELETPQGPALLEIKGMGFYYYKFLNEAFEKGGHQACIERLNDKHMSYMRQMQISMYLSGHKLCYLVVKDRASGTIGLHNSDTGERTGIYVPFDQELFDDTMQRFAYVTRKLDENEAPLPEKTPGSNDCGWCEFRYRCHDMMKREKNGEEPFILYPGPQMGDYNGDQPESSSVDGSTD